MENPLVTVYITTKNRPQLLKRAVDSVLEQSYQRIELIVVDDGSTQETAEYLTQPNLCARVTTIRHTSSKGACASRNAAINAANGSCITGLDDDDYFARDRIQSFVDAWVGVADGYSALFSNFEVKTRGGVKRIELPIVVTSDTLKRQNAMGCQIFTNTLWLRDIGGFDEDMPAWQDYETWFRLVERFGPALNTGLFTYTVDTTHEHERISSSLADRFATAHEKFMCKHRSSFDESQAEIFRLNLLAYPQVNFGIKELVSGFKKSLPVGRRYLERYLAKKFKSF